MTLSQMLKWNGTFVVTHWDSSECIKKHHKSCHAVMYDPLPGKSEMHDLFQQAALNINQFIDEPGFCYVMAQKQH